MKVKFENKFIICLVAALLCALVSTCVCAPLFIETSSDVMYANSLLPPIFALLERLLSEAYTYLLIAAAVFAAHRYNSSRKIMNVSFVFCVGVILVRYAANTITAAVTTGYFDLGFDAVAIIVQIALDTLLILLPHAVCRKRTAALNAKNRELARAQKYAVNAPAPEPETAYPFASFFSFSSPILSSVAGATLACLAIALIQRVFSDVALGAPTSLRDLIDMIFGYSSDVLCALLGYGVAYFALSLLLADKKSEK